MKTKSTLLSEKNISREINQIKKAFKYAEKIKAGKLKGRPAEELLSEL
jgi:hypothetical protein